MSKKKEIDIEPKEMLVVKTKLKDYVKTLGDFNVSAGFYEEFNLRVAELARRAVKRAKHNNRKTVSAKDV
jgi:histone H3/H4